MKHLVLIIHDDLKLDTADLLHNIEEVQGFTFSNAEGHSKKSDSDSFLSDRDRVVGYTSRVRVDILLDDKDLIAVLAALRKSDIGLNKHGIYWITAVEKYEHL